MSLVASAARPPSSPAAVRARLRRVRHVALDMDGTIYRGGRLFAATNPFLRLLQELGIGVTFLTNNSSRSVTSYVRHLREMGVPAAADQMHTSTLAAINYLREQLPRAKRLWVLGTRSMRSELAAAGWTILDESSRQAPDAVVTGFDTDLRYSRLCRTAYWISQGKPYVATHPDRVCPTDQPTVLVDCGAITAALESATGRAPDAVVGKPNPRMLRDVLQRYELQADELAMAGDRLYTDVDMAHAADALAVLLLTGEATAAEAARHPRPPDLVATDLAEFGRALVRARGAK